MSRRRTSGEIINATLLEIFLSFIFVVLAVAWFGAKKLAAAQAAAGAASARADSAARAQASADSLARALAAAQTQRDSLERLYRSQLRPYCEDEYALEITLNAPRTWTVRVLRDGYGHTQGEVLQVSPSGFLSAFQQHLAHSDGPGQCRFRVITHDTPSLSKAEYKVARAIIRSRFYVSEQ